MGVTRIELIDRSLVRIGSDPLQSETAPGAETHLAVWNSIVETILSSHPWTCVRFTRQLVRKVATPETHWKYAYEMPAEMIGDPIAVFDRKEAPRAPFTDFEPFANRELRTDAENIWVHFTKNVEPAFWPGYLREVIVLLNMSELALSVREDAVLRDRLRGNAIGSGALEWQGGLLGTAKGINDMNRPSPVIGETFNPVADARFGHREIRGT